MTIQPINNAGQRAPQPAPPTANPISPPAARDAALGWLLGRINYERTGVPYQARQLKLDRMRQLLTRLGQPDIGLKIVHVAGTKGKGSTCAMIAAMLTAAGYRTGLFSSPHLERIEERFAVDGEICTPDELVTLIDRVKPEVHAIDDEAAAGSDAANGPTYFEITTAMALLHFVEHGCDAVVLEVGLGGRLDSTNVCLPAVSVITSISFDHMRQLGRTLAEIAREKAGIIKPGVPVVSGVCDSEPHAVIADIAREHGCRLIQLGRDFDFAYHPPTSVTMSAGQQPHSVDAQAKIDFVYHVAGQDARLSGVALAMRGRHQAANAAIALATIAELRHQGWCISTAAVRHGLSRALLPGRVEIVPGDPMIVLDTAHNPASARALVEALAELPPAPRRTLIVSISHDKDVPAVARELVPHFDRVVVTQYQENPRAVPAQDLAAIIANVFENADSRVAGGAHSIRPDVLIRTTPREAWQLATATAASGERICIAGSFFLAAEMRSLVYQTHAAENSDSMAR